MQALVDRIWGNTLAFCKFGHGVLVAVEVIEQARDTSIVALRMSVSPPNLAWGILGVSVVDAIEGGSRKSFWTDLKEEFRELAKPGADMGLGPREHVAMGDRLGGVLSAECRLFESFAVNPAPLDFLGV
jgi:hypothetical protein